MNDTLPTDRQRYPLTSLFVLVAACAVIVRLTIPLAQSVLGSHVELDWIGVALIVGLALGVVIGPTLGAFHYHRLRGIWIGFISGVVLGPLCGLLMVIPLGATDELIVTTFGCSVLLVVLGGYMRLKIQADDANS